MRHLAQVFSNKHRWRSPQAPCLAPGLRVALCPRPRDRIRNIVKHVREVACVELQRGLVQEDVGAGCSLAEIGHDGRVEGFDEPISGEPDVGAALVRGEIGD